MPVQERPKRWKHQKLGKRLIRERLAAGHAGACLFFDPGTGKTRPTIEEIERLILEDKAKLILVVNILAGLKVWVDNWARWADTPVVFVDLHAGGERALKKAVRLSKQGAPVICLVNYHSSYRIGRSYVEHKRDGQIVRVLEPTGYCLDDAPWDMVICDEADALSGASSKVSKFFRGQNKRDGNTISECPVRIALTGTAYTKTPLHAYPVIKWVTKDEVFTTKQAFLARYAIPHQFVPHAIAGWHNLDDFAQRLASVAMIAKEEDCMDIPAGIDFNRYVELGGATQKAYREITKDLETKIVNQLKSGEISRVTANHVFTIMGKQLQILAGHAKDENGETVRIGAEKAEALERLLIERDGRPTLIVTQHKESVKIVSEVVRKLHGADPKVLDGSVMGSERRYELVRSAATDPAFVVNEAVACKSIDMQWATMTIWYEHKPNTINYVQMRARNRRGEQTKRVRYAHILALPFRGFGQTADERVLDIIEGNLNVEKEIDTNWKALLR